MQTNTMYTFSRKCLRTTMSSRQAIIAKRYGSMHHVWLHGRSTWREPLVTHATGRSDKSGTIGTEASGPSSAWARCGMEARSRTVGQWGSFLAALAVAGAGAGTLLDGIHSKDALQLYDMLSVQIGGLHTSWAVPPLLAAFYMVLGSLVPLADAAVGGDDTATQQVQARASQPAYVLLGVGLLAAELQLSAHLYSSEVSFSTIFTVLGAVTCANWAMLDGTKQGVALAVLCALGAPAAEVVLLHFLPLWHYPRADILGGAFVSWVPWCYAFYTPALTNFARFCWGASR